MEKSFGSLTAEDEMKNLGITHAGIKNSAKILNKLLKTE